MAIPRVFISSTCYDLKHIRENLKYFVKTIGYEPVLSDEGDVFYNPSVHTHDSCIKEVKTCQIFILIIGGRYGGYFKESDNSITNSEYREAVCSKIPVFALVESSVHSDHHVFSLNKKKSSDFAGQIEYPSIDNIKIFDFIDEVRKNTLNNAIFPFRDFSDMESYLKKQWAGMMYDFLVQRSGEENSKVTNRLLDDLTLATKKSEELIKVLLRSSSSEDKAEETIKAVDNKVEAENFAKLVLDKFSLERLYNTSAEQLSKIDLNKSWIEFLTETNDFYIDEVHSKDGADQVLWGTASKGLQIGHYADDTLLPDSLPNMEKAYQALRKVDKETRLQIYQSLAEGF